MGTALKDDEHEAALSACWAFRPPGKRGERRERSRGSPSAARSSSQRKGTEKIKRCNYNECILQDVLIVLCSIPPFIWIASFNHLHKCNFSLSVRTYFGNHLIFHSASLSILFFTCQYGDHAAHPPQGRRICIQVLALNVAVGAGRRTCRHTHFFLET